MAGLRGDGKKLHYPVSELAARHNASTPEETETPKIAYSDWDWEDRYVRLDWPL
jgi:hypothetical protein